jgi:hypothetical protein
MADDADEKLNPDAVNAPYPTSDQLKALLDVMEETDDDSWINNPNHELRAALRAVEAEKREVDTRLKAASAALRRDFGPEMD